MSSLTENQDRDQKAYLDAINRIQAVIEFDLNGNILHANDNFLAVVGYNLDEIVGQHHRMFCEPEFTESAEYADFWQALRSGKVHSGEYKRLTKKGDEIWINASYNPVFDDAGNPNKIVKFATDITQSAQHNADTKARIDAVDRVQAVIEFNLDGTIIHANQNFLDTVGYALEEIVGQHHRIFCDADYASSPEYVEFWRSLNSGQFDTGVYKRCTKTGKEIWIQASYNPVFDASGNIRKVVKFATDITDSFLKNLDFESKMNAIDKSQAVIEFTLDGEVLKANNNFLVTLGYQLEEIEGKHHRIFCKKDHSDSPEYAEFWQKLRAGESFSGLFERVARGGETVWIQATYNPILGPQGEPVRVVKFASDVTKDINERNDLQNQIETISTSLAEMSNQISEETNKVATGAQALGATTEEMSACVEELSASIDSIAQNTKAADDQAKTTKQHADLGVDAIDQSIEAMELINKSSEEVQNILMVIGEIASQTNLLAFNAAIEAARAGEHGLGFSVVADEVRKLAERSSKATQDISKLIGESTKRIERGSEVSKAASESFKSIVTGVVNTANSISEISVATAEQQAAARDVAGAIEQVANSAETSANATHVIAGSTKELADEANKLLGTFGRKAS